MKTPFVLGRLLFGGFFLYNGINHILNRKTLSQYAGSKKVPVPHVAVTGSGVALILGGASILLVTMFLSDQLAQEARKAGAQGACPKERVSCVVNAVEAVLRRETYFPTQNAA